MSNIMFVPGSAVGLGDFSGGRPIYDPLTNRANPDFNPALPITAANPQFIRTQFPDNKIPLDRINPVAFQVLQQYVVQPNLRRPDRQLPRHARPASSRTIIQLPRSIASWTNGASLFARYSLSNENGFTPENLPGFGAHHDNRVQNLSVTLVNPARNVC